MLATRRTKRRKTKTQYLSKTVETSKWNILIAIMRILECANDASPFLVFIKLNASCRVNMAVRVQRMFCTDRTVSSIIWMARLLEFAMALQFKRTNPLFREKKKQQQIEGEERERTRRRTKKCGWIEHNNQKYSNEFLEGWNGRFFFYFCLSSIWSGSIFFFFFVALLLFTHVYDSFGNWDSQHEIRRECGKKTTLNGRDANKSRERLWI